VFNGVTYVVPYSLNSNNKKVQPKVQVSADGSNITEYYYGGVTPGFHTLVVSSANGGANGTPICVEANGTNCPGAAKFTLDGYDICK
jgi:hypothetical protein